MLIKKTIGYISRTDPFKDRKAWSGIEYKLREAIELAGFKVIWIPYQIDTFRVFGARICRKIEELFSQGIFMNGELYKPIAKAYAQSIDISLVERCDYLFFPGKAQIAFFLKTDRPYIGLSDCTVSAMAGYYWFGLSKRFIVSAAALEKKACCGAMFNIRPSQWALDYLIRDYHCPVEKCHLLEFGPNIDTKDITPVEPYREGALSILFSGVDWERKGDDIAVETVRLLREQGVDAHLLVAGPKICPTSIRDCECVTFVGFLDKDNPKDYQTYIDLYKQCHLLLLPTRAECAGIVFCEASAFGIPSYSYATGGVQNYVINDYNGYAFPLSAHAKDFAQKIYADLYNNKFSIYHTNAQTLFKEKLSWEAWALRFSQIMSQYDD